MPRRSTRGLPHGLLRRPGRQRADAPPPLRAARHGGLTVGRLGRAGDQPAAGGPGRCWRSMPARAAPARRPVRRVLRRCARTRRGRRRENAPGAARPGRGRARRGQRRLSGARDLARCPAARAAGATTASQLPTIEDADISGTTAAGVAPRSRAARRGRLAAIPYWRDLGPAQTLDGVFDARRAVERPVTLIANLATHHLWGRRRRPPSCSAHLYEGKPTGRPPTGTWGTSCAWWPHRSGRAGSLYGSPTPTRRSATAACTCSRRSGSRPRSSVATSRGA